MKKLQLLIILFLLLIIPINVFATEAKIIVIRIGDEGDATLLRSQNKYILVDAGTGTNAIDFIDHYFIQEHGSDYGNKIELSVIISHYHIDHIGGIYDSTAVWTNNNLVNALKKGKIYLPDTTYLDNYAAYATSKGWTYTDYKSTYYSRVMTKASENGIPCETVKAESNIPKIGDIEVSIIGPIGGECKGSCIDKYVNAHGNNGSRQGHYVNDNSLVTMFKIGNIKYLSAGDIESSVELASYVSAFNANDSLQEEKLVSSKCSEIKADIFKLSHHGLPTSNSKNFLRCINPRFVFYSHNEYTEVTNEITQIVNDWRYNFNIYSTESGGNGSFIFNIKDDTITVDKINFTESAYTKFNSSNFVNITINYVDSDTNKTIKTSTSSFSTLRGKYYYLTEFIEPVDGYIYDIAKNANLTTGGSISSDKSVNVYFKKTNHEIDNTNNIIKGISVRSNGDTLLNKLGLTEGNKAAFYHGNKAIGWADMVKTGDKLTFNLNDNGNTYTLIVKGDINGDGNITKNVARSIANYIIDGRGISDTNKLLAADYDSNGKIKMNDVLRILNEVKTGWINENGATYYYDNDGTMAVGWKELTYQGQKGKFYFDKNGKMVKGANVIDNYLYYFDTNTGILSNNLSGYSFNSDGYLLADAGWLQIGNTKFYSNGSNKFTTDWQQIDSKWYYFDELGKMQTGLRLTPYNGGQYWYYFDSNGVMTSSDWQKVDDKWYYFFNGGTRAYGWQKIGDYWYYLQDDGVMATSWKKIDYNLYYFNPGGSMVSNTCKEIEGSQFCFNSSGVCTSGTGC